MQEITVSVSLDEANLVREALGNLPFSRVYALIGKMQEQAGRQIKAGAAPAAGEPRVES